MLKIYVEDILGRRTSTLTEGEIQSGNFSEVEPSIPMAGTRNRNGLLWTPVENNVIRYRDIGSDGEEYLNYEIRQVYECSIICPNVEKDSILVEYDYFTNEHLRLKDLQPLMDVDAELRTLATVESTALCSNR